MKSKYETPKMEVVNFEAEDVITTSAGEGGLVINPTSEKDVIGIFDIFDLFE